MAGLKGIVLVAGVLIALFATTLCDAWSTRDAHLFVALVVALLAVGGLQMHFLARPHLFTLLLLSISVWMIEADRKRHEHPDLVAGSAHHRLDQSAWRIPGADRSAGSDDRGQPRSRPGSATSAGDRFAAPLRYGQLTAACAAASLVNPYGWDCTRMSTNICARTGFAT